MAVYLDGVSLQLFGASLDSLRLWYDIFRVPNVNDADADFVSNHSVPFEANWNLTIPPERCWAYKSLGLAYTQGISNIITDAMYMAAPIIYLSRVQLSKRTQLGIRIVFLLSIP
jgi:hypothetical protein